MQAEKHTAACNLSRACKERFHTRRLAGQVKRPLIRGDLNVI
jgi:hypothetical protein